MAAAGLAALLLALAGCSDGGGRVGAQGTPGITAAPCPGAVDRDKGCIYLGALTDVSGPFSAIAIPSTEAQRAFWKRVNQQGGIGGYEVDVTRYTRDTRYDVATFEAMYEETKDDVFAYSQLLGSPQIHRVLPSMEKEKILGVPLSWSSEWFFTPNVLEAGGSYCVEAMNAVDYAAETFAEEKRPYKVKSVMAVGYPDEFGADAAGGARAAAERRGLRYQRLPLRQGEGAKAVAQILKDKPSLVVLATVPADTVEIVRMAVRRGYKGRFVGHYPTWVRTMIDVPGMRGQFWQAAPWRPFATDSPGHSALRAALSDVTPSDAYVSGWTFSYGLKAVLEKAASTGRLTRAGLLEAARGLKRVDYEGILPPEAGSDGHPVRETVFGVPDAREYTGIRVVADFYEGDTARSHTFSEPCGVG